MDKILLIPVGTGTFVETPNLVNGLSKGYPS